MKFFLPAFILATLFSCGGNGNKSKTDSAGPKIVKVPALKKGDFNSLYVFTDPTNTYEVYLPSSYDTAKRFPAVIFFDAHGDGHLPLEKYKTLAEKWNYIFIGCNSTKNGMTSDMTMKIGSELINEVKTRFPVDESEMVLCGFSGGARVAAGLGENESDLKGVICNSAAPQSPQAGKVFIGLAGLGDMNYLEMKKFVDGEKQNGNKFPNELLVFDGKHEWAPVDVMEDAILMVNAYDLRNNVNETDCQMAVQLDKNISAQSDSIKNSSCLVAKELLESFDDLHLRLSMTEKNNSESSKKLSSLNSSCVKSDEADWKNAEDLEGNLQKELQDAMLNNDTSWWRTNASSYFETDKAGAEKFMRQRLRGYASLMAYSYSNQAIQVQNPHAADKFITIYSIVDPSNSEWAYLRATFYMHTGMQDYAFPMLEKAVDLGFSDRARLSSDPAFASAQNDPRMSEIFSRIK
ncbi:MAG: hypothetical protein HY064_06200 [Bacteroidetes bacterium]|nr:hypothetical protein [Bacteroidota bacterium]